MTIVHQATRRDHSEMLEEVPLDVPLGQVAWVLAAEQDGFTLANILAKEGLDVERYERARADVVERVAVDPDLYEEYSEAQRLAQDRLHCPIKPLYDDLAAWLALSALIDVEGYDQAAGARGLTWNDVARLERHWQRRLRADGRLDRRARQFRRDGVALPELQIGQRHLVRSPWGHEPHEAEIRAETPVVPAPAVAAEDFHRMASLHAALQVGVALAVAGKKHGFSDGDAARSGIEAWDELVRNDGALRRDFRALVAHYRKRFELLRDARPEIKGSGAPAESARSRPPRIADATALLPAHFVPFEVWPFGEVASASASASRDETAFLAAFVLDEPAHPFEERAERALDANATGVVDPGLRFRAALPFEAVDAEWPARTPRGLTTSKCEAGETVEARAIVDAAWPFDAPAHVPSSHPELTLVQYACYIAELDLFAARRSLVHKRYGILDEDASTALRRRWAERLAGSEEDLTRYRESYETYRGHLLRTNHEEPR
jgi:hypothetical protein